MNMPRQYFYPQHNQASILVVCLWVIMILSMLGMGLTGLVFQEIKFTKVYQRINFSLPAAKAALKTVFYLRQSDPTPGFDTLGELTEENTQALCADNSYKYYFADKNNSADGIKVIDEGALINLNTASLDVLKRLPGMDEDLAESIVNSGARPFSSIHEVFLIEGMSKDKFILFKDLVTVYGSGKININTASRTVLLALGLDNELVGAILRFRQEYKIKNPDPESTEDLGYGFSSANKIIDDLRSFTSLGLRQEQELLALLSVFDVKSEYLRFNIIPYSGGREGLHYSIVIHPATKKILSWNEY
ncbi:MAG: general secretion pathway protein GspK [Candidatus Omnitrophica bacterium]|nr:general secretion pathway protein GspK [Candidatus Omnitrophota bacterium]MBU4419155.1 general secretion pathway protein GspK [Candidatus Omnitrophota bacterium]MBU4467699.1 general secretion pathway protein GspK [Candidatus Omnitrophota bacterium]MCG2708014.1 general secretion pathway protein GspK [Candidatus Omnitrophota bacterium]